MLRPKIASKHIDGATCLVHLEGEHDVSSAPHLRETLDRLYETGSYVVVDLTWATFIDSTILGELIRAYLRTGESPNEKMAIVAPPGSPAAKLFDLVDAPSTATERGANSGSRSRTGVTGRPWQSPAR